MKYLLLLALVSGLARAADLGFAATDLSFIAKNVWAPDRQYVEKCLRGVDDPIELTTLILAQSEYFDALASRFNVVEPTVKSLKTNAERAVWDMWKVTKVDDLVHYSALNVQAIWVGPLEAVGCHFAEAAPYLSATAQTPVKALAARIERVKKLYGDFLKSAEDEKWIQYEMFAEASLEAWDRAEELIQQSEKNLFVGHRSRAQRSLLSFSRTLFNSNSRIE